MPRFQPLSPERIAEAQRQSAGWGEIELEPTDNVRSIKRRTTIAGKELGRVVKWHHRSTKETLLFRVVEPGSIQRRTRRTREAS